MNNELVSLLHSEFDALDKQVVRGWMSGNRPLFARYTALSRVFNVQQRSKTIPQTDAELFEAVKYAINTTTSILVEDSVRHADVIEQLNYIYNMLRRLYDDGVISI